MIKRIIKMNKRDIKLWWLFEKIFVKNESLLFGMILFLDWLRESKNGCIEESVNTSLILLIRIRTLSNPNCFFLLKDKFLNILLIIWIKDIFW